MNLEVFLVCVFLPFGVQESLNSPWNCLNNIRIISWQSGRNTLETIWAWYCFDKKPICFQISVSSRVISAIGIFGIVTLIYHIKLHSIVILKISWSMVISLATETFPFVRKSGCLSYCVFLLPCLIPFFYFLLGLLFLQFLRLEYVILAFPIFTGLVLKLDISCFVMVFQSRGHVLLVLSLSEGTLDSPPVPWDSFE